MCTFLAPKMVTGGTKGGQSHILHSLTVQKSTTHHANSYFFSAAFGGISY